jgi:hypothetical protein
MQPQAPEPSAEASRLTPANGTPAPKVNQFAGSPLGKLAQTGTSPWVVVGETLLLPLIALVLGLQLQQDDPLWTHADFPWAWLAPVVVALRYGPLAGLGAAGVLLAGWLGLNQGHYNEFPQVYFLGGLITVMVVGEFSSLWRARARRAETIQFYLEQRLEHLVHQYYLLRLSHDRLEQELIGRPMSMRDALKTLRSLGDEEKDAQALLRLLAQFCQISAATLHTVVNDQPQPTSQATLGNATGLQANDPLVQQALQTHRLCHVAQATVQEVHSNYLVVAPLLDVGGNLYGLLLIEEMPFFALQEENLQTINLLLGYYTDGLSTHALASPLQVQAPDCPTEFAFELQRLWHMQQATSVPSVIVALEFVASAIERGLPEQVIRLKRMLDEVWLIKGPRRQVLAVLMPLGDASTAEGFMARMEGWIAQKENMTLSDAGIFSQTLVVQNITPAELIERLQTTAHA